MMKRVGWLTTVALAAAIASGSMVSRPAETPQVSAAQLEVLAGALAAAPAEALDAQAPAAQSIVTDPPGTAAAVDMFLKIEGVDGESDDATHKGELEIESFSWGASNPAAGAHGGGGGAGKVSMQDISFVMKTSKASPKLFLMCATGEHIKSATITLRKAGREQQEYLTIKLENVQITSYQIGGNGETPTDQVSINFTKIEFEYKPQKPDGSLDAPVKAGYDLKKNEKV
jgi:type VI secretion system secreted protein Hcp